MMKADNRPEKKRSVVLLRFSKGGNQRELARAKAAKKLKDVEKGKKSSEKGANKGMTLEERRHRDAEIMRQKQEKKDAVAAAAQGATGGK